MSGSPKETERPMPLPPSPDQRPSLAQQDVLGQVAKTLAPFVVLFGIYVITHGEIGPGGGFQGGVIIAAAYILYALIYGMPAARAIVPRAVTDNAAPAGVLLYVSVGVVSLFDGKNFLDYDVFERIWPGHAQPLGMTLVELGVGLTVASVMVTVFCEIVAREAPAKHEDEPKGAGKASSKKKKKASA